MSPQFMRGRHEPSIQKNSGTIPAKERYNSAQYTDCSQSSIITIIGSKEPNPLIVFPNPAMDILHLQFTSENTGTTFQIKTLEGKTVIDNKFKTGISKEDIDISSLKPGIYILSVETERGSFKRKIIKL